MGDYNERQKEFYRVRKEIILAFKETPCKDCAVLYPPYVMQFDHREGRPNGRRKHRIDASLSLERLIVEIEKCDIVCANCHCIRTHNRGQLRVGGRRSRRKQALR